jgi:four helix bundle protein
MMTNWTTLPHERLIAFQVARKLLLAVSEAKISDPKLRDQALRAAKSACLNIAEAVGRYGEADKARVFAIARGEACEVAAAVDIAALAGECSAESSRAVGALAREVYALLTGLIRR